MAVVVVESPAKAKTINKYLGSDYTVLASYGHVRDLPPKDGSVDTEHDFAMKWEVAADSKKHIRAITEALKTDQNLILATDPDREGEAISWHLQEALASSLKKGATVSRVTFNAITKAAVTEAMKNPRQVDQPLVDAYLARRALFAAPDPAHQKHRSPQLPAMNLGEQQVSKQMIFRCQADQVFRIVPAAKRHRNDVVTLEIRRRLWLFS